MKTKFKHALAERLKSRKIMTSWRARNPERDCEIKRRYFERRRLRFLVAEETDERQKQILLRKLEKLPKRKPGKKKGNSSEGVV